MSDVKGLRWICPFRLLNLTHFSLLGWLHSCSVVCLHRQPTAPILGAPTKPAFTFRDSQPFQPKRKDYLATCMTTADSSTLEDNSTISLLFCGSKAGTTWPKLPSSVAYLRWNLALLVSALICYCSLGRDNSLSLFFSQITQLVGHSLYTFLLISFSTNKGFDIKFPGGLFLLKFYIFVFLAQVLFLILCVCIYI